MDTYNWGMVQIKTDPATGLSAAVVDQLAATMRHQGVSIRELVRRTGYSYTMLQAVFAKKRHLTIAVYQITCQCLNISPVVVIQQAKAQLDTEIQQRLYALAANDPENANLEEEAEHQTDLP